MGSYTTQTVWKEIRLDERYAKADLIFRLEISNFAKQIP